jgi:hypothetical protein
MDSQHLWKHSKCIDVVFGPINIKKVEMGLELQGFWYNISTRNITRIELDTITITNDELPNWEIYNAW